MREGRVAHLEERIMTLLVCDLSQIVLQFLLATVERGMSEE
jgi:hypothetical protein